MGINLFVKLKDIVADLEKKSGLLKKKYPTNIAAQQFSSLHLWRNSSSKFFFTSKDELKDFPLDSQDRSDLRKEFQNFLKGYLRFFNGQNIYIGRAFDWISNPENKHQFDINKHWSEIDVNSPAVGDIKYVWEKSRFTYLYTIIRYDFHYKEDQSDFVFNEILSWISSNPINQGPNYVSGQEISLRVLNWTFALYYYKNKRSLTEETFQKIINSIYWQTQHVDKKIELRGKVSKTYHTLTEALLLYSIGSLFSFFPESKKWMDKGKAYLEELAFTQILEDGAHIQLSMNYQRSVIQIYTWAFYLAKSNKDSFSTALYERLERALNFLYQHQDAISGMLPNYGANNGIIFFPLNSCNFRDFRPQLNAFYNYYHQRSLFDQGAWDEDLFWYTGRPHAEKKAIQKKTKPYDNAGFYLLRTDNKFASIRCGNYKVLPAQEDNLHLDIWAEGNNLLRDSGSYRYFSEEEDVRFFSETHSHNTVVINNTSQVGKENSSESDLWTEVVETKLETFKEYLIFRGKIKTFKHVGPDIFHTRVVKQHVNNLIWEVEDIIENNQLPIFQIWNISPDFFKSGFDMTCTNRRHDEIKYQLREGYYSPTYGVKENSKQIIFETSGNYFKTIIFKKPE